MRLSLCVAAAAALVTASAAMAQDAAEVSIDTPVVEKPGKVICRSMRTTSSRMAVRVCETESQKKARLAKARDRQVKDGVNGRGAFGVEAADRQRFNETFGTGPR